jgi:hypothetical protein
MSYKGHSWIERREPALSQFSDRLGSSFQLFPLPTGQHHDAVKAGRGLRKPGQGATPDPTPHSTREEYHRVIVSRCGHFFLPSAHTHGDHVRFKGITNLSAIPPSCACPTSRARRYPRVALVTPPNRRHCRRCALANAAHRSYTNTARERRATSALAAAREEHKGRCCLKPGQPRCIGGALKNPSRGRASISTWPSGVCAGIWKLSVESKTGAQDGIESSGGATAIQGGLQRCDLRSFYPFYTLRRRAPKSTTSSHLKPTHGCDSMHP